MKSLFHSTFGVGRLALGVCFCLLLAASASADSIFAGSDTFVVTNSASAVITATNAPLSGGTAIPWHPAGILANFRDSPTGAVLIIQHVRAGIVNGHIKTNGTISITNTLYTSSTGATSAIIWDPTNAYTITPTNDSLRITTSSTNAEIILNKEIRR